MNTKMTVVEEEHFMKHWDVARASWDAWFERNGDVEFEEVPVGADLNPREWTGWESSPDEAIQVRMDWELVAEDTEDEITHKIVMGMMAEQLLMDICDVAENGDTDKVNDPALRLADGAAKHGKTLKALEIVEARGFQQFNIHKDATEYVFYLAFNYIWE